MTDSAPALGVGMVGYAFMGAVHSQAWRTAGRFFDLPFAPAMTALCGRDPAGHRGGGRADGLGLGGDRLEATCSPATTSTSSTSARRVTPTPRSRSRRSRPASTCCARSRWPTRWRRPRRWSRPRGGGRGARRPLDGGVQLPPGAGHRARPPAGRRTAGSAPSGTSGRSTCRTGSSTRQFPLVWRLQKDKAGLGCSRGHRRAHHRPGAVRRSEPPSPACPGSPRRSSGSARCRRRRPGWPRPAARRHRRGHRRRRRAVPRAVRRQGAVGSFEATRFATGRKNAMRLEINGSRRQHRVRLRVDERAAVPRPHRGRRDRGLPADPGDRAAATRTSRPGGRPGTGSATSTPSPTRSSTWSRRSARDGPRRPSFADGLQVQRVLSAVERSQHMTAAGRRRRPGSRQPAELKVAQRPA